MEKEERVFSDYLRRKDLKLTWQRQEILTAFLSTEDHVSAEDLYESLKQRDPKIGLTTVYRTLKLLAECGLAMAVDFDDGRTRFEHQYNHRHHDHLVCVQCGHLIEVVDPEIERLQEVLARKHNFTPQWHRLKIFGVCADCRTA